MGDSLDVCFRTLYSLSFAYIDFEIPVVIQGLSLCNFFVISNSFSRHNNWCNLLIETLKTSFGTLSQQIANNNDDTKKLSQQIVDIDVRNQLEDLKNTLDNSIVAIKNTANDALQLAQSNATSITSMKDELRNEFRVELAVVNSKYTNLEAENVTLKNICADLQAENVQLKEDRDDNDIYSRKSNLVLKGIPESKDEDDNQCETVVKTFF